MKTPSKAATLITNIFLAVFVTTLAYEVGKYDGRQEFIRVNTLMHTNAVTGKATAFVVLPHEEWQQIYGFGYEDGTLDTAMTAIANQTQLSKHSLGWLCRLSCHQNGVTNFFIENLVQ